MSKPNQIFSEADTERWLSDQEPVWRYVPLRTLFSYLNGLVFIPSVATLHARDPFECHCHHDSVSFNTAFHGHYGTEESKIEDWIFNTLCSPWERNHITTNKHYAGVAAKIFMQHYLNFIRQNRFAWCWFHSYDESAAMWNTYGNQGVAVQSTVQKINAALETTGRDFIYGKMTYVEHGRSLSTESDFDQEQDDHLILRPFFLKRNEYKSEDEVRFVTAGPRRDLRGGILLKNLKPECWISAIRLWPGLKPDEEKSLKEAIGKFFPSADCRKSDLLPGPLDSVDLVDERRDWEQLDDESWNQGTDDIPPPLKIL